MFTSSDEKQDLQFGAETTCESRAKDLTLENNLNLDPGSRLSNSYQAKNSILNSSPLRHAVSARSVETDAHPQVALANNTILVPSIPQAPNKYPDISLKGVPHTDSYNIPEALDRACRPIPGSAYYTPLEQLREHNSFFAETTPKSWDDMPTEVSMDAPQPIIDQTSIHPLLRCKSGSSYDLTLSDVKSSKPSEDVRFSPDTSFLEDSSEYDPQNPERSISSSDNTQEIFSVGLAASTVQTEATSPYHLSQTMSPLKSDFGDGLLDSSNDYNSDAVSNTIRELEKLHIEPHFEETSIRHQASPYRASGGFEGYILPEDEQSSALTLRNLPSTTYKSPNRESSFSQHGSKDLVRSWNDGSEHRINMTALDELVEDLGYLGEMII